ncbi:MAG: hypothetical protein JWN41_1443, partial [Thermoleophilia bacterium]|nr:hypothetical protein [Thermoleophilia bacterium]
MGRARATVIPETTRVLSSKYRCAVGTPRTCNDGRDELMTIAATAPKTVSLGSAPGTTPGGERRELLTK